MLVALKSLCELKYTSEFVALVNPDTVFPDEIPGVMTVSWVRELAKEAALKLLKEVNVMMSAEVGADDTIAATKNRPQIITRLI